MATVLKISSKSGLNMSASSRFNLLTAGIDALFSQQKLFTQLEVYPALNEIVPFCIRQFGGP